MLMIRNFTIILFLVLTLSMSGCSGRSNQNEQEIDNTSDFEPLLTPSPHLLATSSPTIFPSTVEPSEANTPVLSEQEVTKTPEITEQSSDEVSEATIDTVRLLPPIRTVQFELQPCLGIDSDQNSISSIQWLSLADDVQQLVGLPHPVETLDASLDGRWLIVTLKVDVQNQVPVFSTWMIDTLQEKNLILNSNMSGRQHLTDWFDESQLLWITQDNDVAIGNGESFHKLTAPAPMIEVWYAANSIGFTKDIDGTWWRVQIETDQWEQLNTTDLEPLSGLGVIGISQSKSQALLYQPDAIWQLPLTFGDVASKIDDLEISLVGTSGFNPTINQLGDESSWLISASVWAPPGGQDSYPLNGFVFNTDEKRLFVNADFGLPEQYKILGYSSSPDGEWLAVLVNKSPQVTNVKPSAVYLLQVDNPKAGRLFQDVKNVYLGTEFGVFQDNNTLVALNLFSGDALEIDGAEFWSVIKNTLVAQILPNHLLIVDLTDNKTHDLHIPDGYSLQEILVDHVGKVYFTIENRNSEVCPVSLIKYQRDVNQE